MLSRFAGAAASLKQAILVNPFDPDEVADAIDEALMMPLEERRDRWNALYASVDRDLVSLVQDFH